MRTDKTNMAATQSNKLEQEMKIVNSTSLGTIQREIGLGALSTRFKCAAHLCARESTCYFRKFKS